MNENIVRLCENAKSILVVIGKQARLDGVAAGLGLSLAAMSQGKSVHVCSEVTLPEAQKLVGFDKFSAALDLGGNVLKVAFPYREGAIDKVTYNITDDTFNLLIEPRAGTNPLESKDVRYSYTGGAVDLIVTIDAPSLDALGNIYLDNPDIFVQEKIINIDRRFDNKNYGAENIVEKQASSTSELVLRLIELLRWNINPDIATNLYAGVSTATNNFTSFSTNAGSFEAASNLMKAGARKIPLQPTGQGPVAAPRLQNPQMGNPFGAPAGFGGPSRMAPSPFGAQNPFGANPFGLDDTHFDDDEFFPPVAGQGSMPPAPSAPVMPQMPPRQQQPSSQQHKQPNVQHAQPPRQHQQNTPVVQQQAPVVQQPANQQQNKPQQSEKRDNRPQQQPATQQQNQKSQQETPTDWLKPKIFKSTDLV